jgi:hypothetical protein
MVIANGSLGSEMRNEKKCISKPVNTTERNELGNHGAKKSANNSRHEPKHGSVREKPKINLKIFLSIQKKQKGKEKKKEKISIGVDYKRRTKEKNVD